MYKDKTWLHWSYIVQSGGIVEWGTNRPGVPPIHFGYAARIDGNSPKTHSELDAYRKARGLLDKSEFSVLNLRLNRRGELRMSKPCICCSAFLSVVGCSHIVYSTNNEDFGYWSTYE